MDIEHDTNIDLTDPDNPEWTEEDFAKAEGPGVLTNAELAAFPKTRRPGRPKSASPKSLVSLRVDASVLEHFKASGAGWQTRLNEALAKPLHPGVAEFLRELRQRNATTRERIALLERRDIRLYSREADGREIDITHEAIARDQAMLDDTERLLALTDPWGLTANAP